MRNYFWKDREGKELSFREFMRRWKEGIVNITPVQQTKTTLISFLPIFGGMIWGIAITFIAKTYWLCLVLIGSLPITAIQFINNIQKYRQQKLAEQAYNEAMKGGKNK